MKPPSRAALLLLGIALAGASASAGENRLVSEYARARSAFATKLTRRAPAPQEGEALAAPPGASMIRYGRGGQLAAFVSTRSSVPARTPVVIFLHGGFAWGREDWEVIQPYRDAGFVTVMPVLRGENGQPGSFTFFYDEVNDVVSVIDAVAAMPEIDASRIFLAGHSAGGTLALLVAQVSPRLRAVASFSGSPNQLAFIPQYIEIAPFDVSDRQELIMRSPNQFPSSFLTPVRAYFGGEEAWFARELRAMAKQAQAAHRDVQAVGVPGDHFSALPDAIRRSIAFFRSQAEAR
jgi:dipeptidyl aminopeptidase/acylaminoacyl peptidase